MTTLTYPMYLIILGTGLIIWNFHSTYKQFGSILLALIRTLMSTSRGRTTWWKGTSSTTSTSSLTCTSTSTTSRAQATTLLQLHFVCKLLSCFAALKVLWSLICLLALQQCFLCCRSCISTEMEYYFIFLYLFLMLHRLTAWSRKVTT